MHTTFWLENFKGTSHVRDVGVGKVLILAVSGCEWSASAALPARKEPPIPIG